MNYYKTRFCPECNKELSYSSCTAYCLANRKNCKCRNCSTKAYLTKKNDIGILNNESLISLYWIGFILADGHIRNGRIKILLSIKDFDHLKKYSDYINSSLKSDENKCWTASMNKEEVEKITSKFNINQNKTKNPPSISVFKQLNKTELLSIFIGFIDGDGSIRNLHKRKDFNLVIKCHSSWKDILQMFSNMFLNSRPVTVNSQGYCYLSYGNTTELKNFKREVLKLNLPIMSRKWDVIDLNYISRLEK